MTLNGDIQVVVLPGGDSGNLLIREEGIRPAEPLAERGVVHQRSDPNGHDVVALVVKFIGVHLEGVLEERIECRPGGSGGRCAAGVHKARPRTPGNQFVVGVEQIDHRTGREVEVVGLRYVEEAAVPEEAKESVESVDRIRNDNGNRFATLEDIRVVDIEDGIDESAAALELFDSERVIAVDERGIAGHRAVLYQDRRTDVRKNRLERHVSGVNRCSQTIGDCSRRPQVLRHVRSGECESAPVNRDTPLRSGDVVEFFRFRCEFDRGLQEVVPVVQYQHLFRPGALLVKFKRLSAELLDRSDINRIAIGRLDNNRFSDRGEFDCLDGQTRCNTHQSRRAIGSGGVGKQRRRWIVNRKGPDIAGTYRSGIDRGGGNEGHHLLPVQVRRT